VIEGADLLPQQLVRQDAIRGGFHLAADSGIFV